MLGFRTLFAPARSGYVLNPLRSEREAFRFLLYVAGVALAVVLIVLVVRSL